MSDHSDLLTARIAQQLKGLFKQAADAGLHQLAATVDLAASIAEESTEQPHEYGTAPNEGTNPPADKPASEDRGGLLIKLEHLQFAAVLAGDPHAVEVLKEAIASLQADSHRRRAERREARSEDDDRRAQDDKEIDEVNEILKPWFERGHRTVVECCNAMVEEGAPEYDIRRVAAMFNSSLLGPPHRWEQAKPTDDRDMTGVTWWRCARCDATTVRRDHLEPPIPNQGGPCKPTVH